MNLVFDIGGTNTRVGWSEDGKTLDKWEVFATETDFEKELEKLKEMVRKEKIENAVGGIAGTVRGGEVVRLPNLKNWPREEVGTKLRKVFEAPVILENDAALGGLAEARRGSGRGREIVGFVTVGTGVGGARISEGQIDKTIYGFEPGHQIVNQGLGLEQFVGGKSLERKYGKKPQELMDQGVWKEVAEWLGVGVYNCICLWSPGIIVLGGSVVMGVDMQIVRAKVREYLGDFPAPEIVLGSLGETNVLQGALELLGHGGGLK